MSLVSGSRLGPYEVLGPLGAGGMGEVYRAHDPRLGRDVALKVLPESMAKDADGLARFAREARAVAALNHPHIVTIFSTEEAGDVRFMTMELIEGRTLDRMIPAGGVAFAEFFDVSMALADALSSAHQKQITHRDLKPANVMVTDSGWVKVLDFGLARGGERTGSGPSDQEVVRPALTRDGTILGTGPYMSPEQIEAKRLDGRSDIFSLGVVMYEMATGQRPFHGGSWPALMAAILRDHPGPMTALRPALPKGVERIVLNCLAKDPRDRPQTAHQVLNDLVGLRRAWELSGSESRPEPGSGPGVAAGGLGHDPVTMRQEMGPTTRTPRVKGAASVAVLPFKDLSIAKDQAWLCEGVAEEILNALARLEGLSVTPRDSAFAFAGVKDLRSIGVKLKVATVLTGSIRPIGDQVRVTVEFSDVANGVQVWSGLFDCALRDLLKLEGHVAKTIAEAFHLTTAAGRDISLKTRAMVGSGAHSIYLKGRALAMKRGRRLFPALQQFQKAIEEDPDYSLAWAGVAEVSCLLGYYGLVPPDQYRRRAVSAAERAVAIDPQSAEARSALGCSLLLYQGDPERADQEFQKALELNPGHSQTRCVRALLYLQLTHGRHNEAIVEVRRALNSDPHSPYVKTILGICMGIAGQHEQAQLLLRIAVNADSEALLSRHALAYTLYWAGKFDEAASVIEGAGRMSGYSGFGATMTVMTQARLGRLIEAQRLLAELGQRASSQYIAFTNLAEASFAIGDRASALALAKRALEDREPQFLMYARHAPHFAWLREESGWPAMLRRLDHPGEASS